MRIPFLLFMYLYIISNIFQCKSIQLNYTKLTAKYIRNHQLVLHKPNIPQRLNWNHLLSCHNPHAYRRIQRTENHPFLP